MKTGKKFVLFFTIFLLVFFVSNLVLLRLDILSFNEHLERESVYKKVDVAPFTALDFSSNWIVKIRQGKEHLVELGPENDLPITLPLENKNDTLFFKAPSGSSLSASAPMMARISTPSLEHLKALGGTKIHLENFESETIHVILENGGELTGNNNHFKRTFIKTSGETFLQFNDTIAF